jgi:hypothetical protein
VWSKSLDSGRTRPRSFTAAESAPAPLLHRSALRLARPTTDTPSTVSPRISFSFLTFRVSQVRMSQRSGQEENQPWKSCCSWGPSDRMTRPGRACRSLWHLVGWIVATSPRLCSWGRWSICSRSRSSTPSGVWDFRRCVDLSTRLSAVPRRFMSDFPAAWLVESPRLIGRGRMPALWGRMR